MINLPRLLDGNMNTVCTVTPVNASITRNLYALSTAQLVLPPGEQQVKVRSFMRLFDRYGSAGVFRVSKARNAYGQKLELTLKHGLCVLEDDTVKVSEGKATGTAGQIIQTLWSSPGVTQAPLYWRLGTLAETPTIEFEYSNPKLMDAVWEVLKKVPGYALDFDQSVFPWVLNLVKLGEQVTCEGRFGRNLDSCTVNVDDSAFCSRVYLDDRDGFTDSATAAEWGIASTTLTVPEGADDAAVAEYVAAYLREYGEPRTTITLEASDLSTATGEELDAFSLGKVCRACLPDYNATVAQRIVTLATPEVYKDPDGVVVTMANRTETTSSYLEKLRNNSKSLANQSTIINRRVGGFSAQLENTDIELVRTKEELTDTRYRLSKAGLIINGDAGSVKAFAYQELVDDTRERLSYAGIDIKGEAAEVELLAKATTLEDARQRMAAAGINIDGDASNVKAFAYLETVEGQERRLSSAELILNGAEGKAGLVAQVEDQEGRLSSAELILNGDTASGGLVARVKGAEDTLDDITGSTLWTTRDSVTGLVGKFTINSAGDVVVNKGTGFLIQRDSGTFGVYDSGNLTAGVMVQKINDDTAVIIKAARVDLEGYVTATTLEAEMATIRNIFAGYSEISGLGINGNLYAKNANFTDNLRIFEHYAAWKKGDFVTSVTFPAYQEATIYYTNWSGEQVYQRVLTPVKNTSGSYSKSDNYPYLGY